MRGYKTNKDVIKKVIRLRQKGNSLDEIIASTKLSRATAFNYMKGVEVLPEYRSVFRDKTKSAKLRSEENWEIARTTAKKYMQKPFSKSAYLIIATCLYWAEGAKMDFSLSNTDSNLVTTFLNCMYQLGVQKEDLRVTIRVYEDIDKKAAIKYWADVIGVSISQIRNVNILFGKKSGKLKYGMCRVRIRKGGRYLKLLKSAASELHSALTSP